MEGFGSLLRLAPVALEALLGVAATAHSGFGLFSGVSFGWGHADLVCIVMRSIPDIRETMSHRVSMSHRMDENLAIMQSHKPCIMNNFHEVASGNPLSCSLIFKFGKARVYRCWASTCTMALLYPKAARNIMKEKPAPRLIGPASEPGVTLRRACQSNLSAPSRIQSSS